eukprot:CAMPEP_0178445296 /NCGR_PEP_ID=MMETSP0689_2-20121128/40065_1 /TAXON_ID=160604 /ORGANISM="Amphidinium massartii, Strain CS-259" /LENGTH=62 /DNA_ID=CAMNT_0020069785 /DNA_START=345 /DNA_END=533 /DNA_ORIENTATION=-
MILSTDNLPLCPISAMLMLKADAEAVKKIVTCPALALVSAEANEVAHRPCHTRTLARQAVPK